MSPLQRPHLPISSIPVAVILTPMGMERAMRLPFDFHLAGGSLKPSELHEN